MTAAFWWYLLAGFIIGFCLSTVWEWLYFRQRRMYITDRRIAALEQQLESQKRAAASREIPSEPGVTWTATEYQSPGVLLENETDAQPAPRAAVPVTAAVLRAEQANGRGSLAVDPAPPWARAAAVHTVANAPLPADAPSGATVAAPESAEIDSHAAAQAVAATALVAHAMTADEPAVEQNAAPPPPDAERHAAEAVAATALVAHAMTVDEPAAEQNAAPSPPDAERHAAEAAAAAALVAHAMADERTEEQAEAENAPTAAPPPPAESAPVMAPTDADATAVTTEVRGFSARQGYIVSELSPAEFTALKATQKARQAARKAWEQARAVTDYLRNV